MTVARRNFQEVHGGWWGVRETPPHELFGVLEAVARPGKSKFSGPEQKLLAVRPISEKLIALAFLKATYGPFTLADGTAGAMNGEDQHLVTT